LTLLKEHYLPNFAKRFQAAGIATLVYDHRGWGSSDGSPRNIVDPMQQAEDYHDAVIFAGTLPGVDATRIAIWGIGHSGGASMIAAGDDPNIKAVVLIMPFVSGSWDAQNFPAELTEKLWEERKEASAAGRAWKPTYVKVWDESLEEAQGPRNDILLHSPAAFEFYAGAKQRSDAAGTPWENRLRLDSLYRIAKVEPRDHIHKIAPRPLLYIAATTDPLSGPYEAQMATFERAGEPKTFVTLEDDHISNYFRNFEANITAQIEFLQKNL
jgi:fermentation-respiration switch protein FrsA (DUF1100 family)